MGRIERTKRSWRECRETVKHRWQVPFIFLEWLCEQVSHLLGRWAFLEILEYAGRLAILVAVILYFLESDDRRKAKHYQAWQVINAAQGKPGSGGRIDALQDLNEDKVRLEGVDVSNACLLGIDLNNAFLRSADLSGAMLAMGTFHNANLCQANLSKATLFNADLSKSYISNTNFSGAYLSFVNLSGTDLSGSDFSEADMHNANLSGANLFRANLSGANLCESNLKDIKSWEWISSIIYANIYGVKNAPDGFIEWAEKHGAVSVESWDEWESFVTEKLKEEQKVNQ